MNTITNSVADLFHMPPSNSNITNSCCHYEDDKGGNVKTQQAYEPANETATSVKTKKEIASATCCKHKSLLGQEAANDQTHCNKNCVNLTFQHRYRDQHLDGLDSTTSNSNNHLNIHFKALMDSIHQRYQNDHGAPSSLPSLRKTEVCINISLDDDDTNEDNDDTMIGSIVFEDLSILLESSLTRSLMVGEDYGCNGYWCYSNVEDFNEDDDQSSWMSKDSVKIALQRINGTKKCKA